MNSIFEKTVKLKKKKQEKIYLTVCWKDTEVSTLIRSETGIVEYLKDL